MLKTACSDGIAFGPFVENDMVIQDLQNLHLDVQSIHNLEQDVRKFYLENLMVRYQQLIDLAEDLQILVNLSTKPIATIDMPETMNWINSQVAELLDCSTVRVLLLDEHATFLWCITVIKFVLQVASVHYLDALFKSIIARIIRTT